MGNFDIKIRALQGRIILHRCTWVSLNLKRDIELITIFFDIVEKQYEYLTFFFYVHLI